MAIYSDNSAKENNPDIDHDSFLIDENVSPTSMNKSKCDSYTTLDGNAEKCSLNKSSLQDKTNTESCCNSKTDRRSFICDICNRGFKRRFHLKSHYYTHYSVKMYACDICNSKFHTTNALQRHKLIHNNDRCFVCDVCSKAFAVKRYLVNHRSRHVSKDCYKCDGCTFSCDCLRILNEHIKDHGIKEAYCCDLCGRLFCYENNVMLHKCLSRDVKPYLCNLCNRRFRKMWNFNAHLTLHTKEKAFVCQICDKGYTTAHLLKRHYTVHTGERPYRCSLCNASFRDRQSCARHNQKCQPNANLSQKSKGTVQAESGCNVLFKQDSDLGLRQNYNLKIKQEWSSVLQQECSLLLKQELHSNLQLKGEEQRITEQSESHLLLKRDEEYLRTEPSECNLQLKLKEHFMKEPPDLIEKYTLLLLQEGSLQKNLALEKDFTSLLEHLKLQVEQEQSKLQLKPECILSAKHGFTFQKMPEIEKECSLLVREESECNSELNQDEKQLEVDLSSQVKQECIASSKQESNVLLNQGCMTSLTPEHRLETVKDYSLVSLQTFNVRNHKSHLRASHECDVCKKILSSAHGLIIHYRSHTGERPFICSDCNKGFASNSDLIRHSFTHTGIKNHVCEMCNRRFSRKNNLNVHLKTCCKMSKTTVKVCKC